MTKVFGKTLKINLNNGEYEIVSSGHRNPQGLSKTKYKNIFISTEHGDLEEMKLILLIYLRKKILGILYHLMVNIMTRIQRRCSTLQFTHRLWI